MSALAEPAESPLRFRDVLRAELAPREGRWAAVTRIAVACSLTVAIAMTFKIPQPTYMTYIVFLVSRDDRNATLTTGIGALAAVTLAVLITLIFSLIDFAEPALRVPVMAALTFCAMYTTRTFALGPLTYLVGFVVVLLHSLIDDVPSPEAFTRATLWVWVIVSVPIILTVALHIVFGHDARLSAWRAVRQTLEEFREAIPRGDFVPWLPQWRGALVPQWEALQKIKALQPGPSQVGTEAVALLLEALTMLEAVPTPISATVREHWMRLLEQCLRGLDDTERRRPEHVPPAGDASSGSTAAAAVSERLFALRQVITQGERATKPRGEERKRVLFAPDALSNPTHWQFALKTTIAVMASYAIYTVLNWPGLRTAIVTCFFVALASLGETVHKLLLRLSGALIGGVLAGVCIVYVLPHMTDIGQLCALIGIVSLGAAWVATSSELLSYAGLQISFAFFLGVLQSYAPANDLTVLRDRVVGILLGNIIITIVFSTLWPESAKTAVRSAAAGLLRALAAVLREGTRAVRMQAIEELAKAEHYQTLSALELRMLTSQERPQLPVPLLSNLEQLTGAALVATAEGGPARPEERLHRCAAWLDDAASRLASGQPLPPAPAAVVAPDLSLREQARRRALTQLEAEIGHVAATPR
jgi:multidrug resistance protein MdtO